MNVADGPINFERLAPDNVQADLNQCNRRCRQIPTIGLHKGEWKVCCLCASFGAKDMLEALLGWNIFNPSKRLTPLAKLAAMRKLRKEREAMEAGKV